jgi:hypothetical protein
MGKLRRLRELAGVACQSTMDRLSAMKHHLLMNNTLNNDADRQPLQAVFGGMSIAYPGCR